MLIREEPATELTIATRILARAGVLPEDGRVTVRVGEVVYLAGRGISNHTMTPYDVAIVRVRDGEVMFGDPADDLDRYLNVYRAHPETASVITRGDGALVSAVGLHECVLRLLDDPRFAAEATEVADTAWNVLVGEARGSGALIGAFPLGEE